MDTLPPHGSWNRYNNHDCRCPECRSAGRLYRKALETDRALGLVRSYNLRPRTRVGAVEQMARELVRAKSTPKRTKLGRVEQMARELSSSAATTVHPDDQP